MMLRTPFARSTEMAIRPRPPQPSTATASFGPSFGSLLIALYTVTAEQARVAANASSMPVVSTRYFGSGTSTCVA